MKLFGRPRAVVLILILGVLVLLAIIGTIFAMLATLDYDAARSYSDNVQARLIAQSGIHSAIASMRTLITEPKGLEQLTYWGEDLNCDGKLDMPEKNQDGDNILETDTCPLTRAVHPSLMISLCNDGTDITPTAATAKDLIEIVKGSQKFKVGVSGLLPGRYRKDGDYFALKIEDLSSRIYVNMDGNDNLQSILENLAEEKLGPGERSAGTRIYNNRPYWSLAEIHAKANLSQYEFDNLSPCLTVLAWCDKDVVKPVAPKDRIGNLYINATNPMTIDGWEQIRPKKIDFPRDANGNIVGRAPVNINGASKEVLVALIRGLKGFYLREPAGGFWYSYPGGYAFADNPQSYRQLGRVLETTPFSKTTAEDIADRIITNRSLPPDPDTTMNPYKGPFHSWAQFNNFCNDVNGLAAILPDAWDRDVLKANFNPNTNLNCFNPDHNRLLWVDKTELTYYTTEFTFYPTGSFEIDSLGRVLRPDNRVLAESEIRTTAKVFDLYRQTTQAEFVNGSRISSNTAFGPTYKNGGLQIMPELQDYATDADYDGYITLATTENSDQGGDFRSSFDYNGINADTAITNTNTQAFVSDTLIANTNTTPILVGHLYPDGVYSEVDSVPEYQFQPNFTNFSLSMWVKPQFHPEDSERVRWFVSWMNPKAPFGWQNAWTQVGFHGYFGIWSMVNGSGTIGTNQTRTSYISSSPRGYGGFGPWAYGPNGAGVIGWDDCSIIAGGLPPSSGTFGSAGTYSLCGSPCLNMQGKGSWRSISPDPLTYQPPIEPFKAGYWMHLGWVRTSFSNDTLYVNGQTLSQCKSGYYDVTDFPVPSLNNLRLGERKTVGGPFYFQHPADATIDEVIIWNGTITDTTAIWRDGRYYQGTDLNNNDSAGIFTSGSIDLDQVAGVTTGTPITVFLVNWTIYGADSLGQAQLYPFNGTNIDGTKIDVTNIDVLINDGADGQWMEDHRGSTPFNSSGQAMTVSAPFHYKVRFNVNDPNLTPLIDTPIFDDITFYYFVGTKFYNWLYVR